MNKGECPGKMQRRAAAKTRFVGSETLALEALRFFAADPGRAERFFTWSGLDASTIRRAASQPGFGFDVLQYLMQDEPLLLSFADYANLDPADVAAAYKANFAREGSGDEDP